MIRFLAEMLENVGEKSTFLYYYEIFEKVLRLICTKHNEKKNNCQSLARLFFICSDQMIIRVTCKIHSIYHKIFGSLCPPSSGWKENVDAGYWKFSDKLNLRSDES